MRWLKSDWRKIGIALAGPLLLLALVAWLPVSAAAGDERASRSATPGMARVQATPTEDATVTALNKEKLAQEVQQLKEQNEPDFFGWFRTNASILLSTLVVVIGGLIGLWRWLGDRRDAQNKELQDRQNEREKRAEERFQSVVEGLGSEREEARVGAAITLRTFLLPGYEPFYRQVFDLAVAHLRLPRSSKLPGDEDIPLPLTTLSQALLVVFKEAFPLARSQNERSRQALDATGIQLDSSYLENADLKEVWMPNASLRSANLWGADLSGAILWRANFNGAKLRGTNLSRADLWGGNLSGAEFKGANLSGASLNKTNLEAALSLKGTDLRGVKGMTKEQLAACKAKGAIIDEDSAVSTSEAAVSNFSPSQGNDTPVLSATFAQEAGPTPDTGSSSATTPKPSPES